MEAAAAEYVYASFNFRRIRLLNLNSHDAYYDGKIALQGSLEDISLDSTRSFDALSYVWGSSQTPNFILIDGKPLPITANCYIALRNLRDYHHVYRIWVDSICINQHDGQEKNTEIPLMRDIYRKARRVYVWLGESITVDGSPYGSDYAMEWLKQVTAGRNAYQYTMDLRATEWMNNPLKLNRLLGIYIDYLMESEYLSDNSTCASFQMLK